MLPKTIHAQGTTSRIQGNRWNRCCIDTFEPHRLPRHLRHPTSRRTGSSDQTHRHRSSLPFLRSAHHPRPIQTSASGQGPSPGGNDLQVSVRKRRMTCQERACPPRSFVQSTKQLPFRARLTTRLSQLLVAQMSHELRAGSGVAVAYGLSCPTVVAQLNIVGERIGEVDRMFIRRLSIDEHRLRNVSYARGRTGKLLRNSGHLRNQGAGEGTAENRGYP